MTPTIKALALVAALGLASPVAAKTLNFTVAIKNYSGNNTYFAAYVVDANGGYVATLHAAGSRQRYLGDLSRWARLISRSGRGVDGTTGASVGSGQSVSGSVFIPDNMFNAGYVLRVETAVENQNYVPNDAAITLEDANNGKSVGGTGYVKSLSISY